MLTQDRTLVDELEFGLEMVRWHLNGKYPLELVTAVKSSDKKGDFYYPAIPAYSDDQQVYIGIKYRTREEFLQCVGRCWDKAINMSR